MSSFLLTIPRRSNRCFKGEEVLSPGEEYYSLLQDDEVNGGFLRRDFCLSCWNIVAKEVLLTARSSWKSKVSVKKEEVNTWQNRDEGSLFLLKEALKSEALDDIADAFVLALYLARRRLLYLRQQLYQEGSLINLYEVAATEEMLAVRKVALSQLNISSIQQRLASKLKG